MTEAQVGTLAIGDRFREALGFLDLIGDIDLGKITAIIAKIQELRNAENTEGQVLRSLELLHLLTTMTPNETDDKISAWLTSIIAGNILSVVVQVVDWLKSRASGQAVIMSFDDATLTSVEAAGFDLGALIQLAQLILSLISRFSK